MNILSMITYKYTHERSEDMNKLEDKLCDILIDKLSEPMINWVDNMISQKVL